MLAAVSVLAAGCGEETVRTVTEERTVVEQAPPANGDRESGGELGGSEPAPKDSGGRGGGSIVVPDVVGKDHQLAQDTMQAAGLDALVEEDCTGQGRLLRWDRNWTVVEQDPPAGARVSEDATITLCSKKDGE